MNDGLERRGFLSRIAAVVCAMFAAKESRGSVASPITTEWPIVGNATCDVESALLELEGKRRVMIADEAASIPEGCVELRVYRVRKFGSEVAVVVCSELFPVAAVEKYRRLQIEDEYRQGWFNQSQVFGVSLQPLPTAPDDLPYFASDGYACGWKDGSEWNRKCHASNIVA